MTTSLELAQPTVSHHLKKLHEAGLLEREQRGKCAYYSLSTDVEPARLAAVPDRPEGGMLLMLCDCDCCDCCGCDCDCSKK